jgi:hypothetical protein
VTEIDIDSFLEVSFLECFYDHLIDAGKFDTYAPDTNVRLRLYVSMVMLEIRLKRKCINAIDLRCFKVL